MTKKVTINTPVWKLAQAVRILDQQIADLQARRKRLLANLDQAKEQSQ